MATQIGSDLYYITSRAINMGSQLKVWYAPHYALKLGKPPHPDGQTKGTRLRISYVRSFHLQR